MEARGGRSSPTCPAGMFAHALRVIASHSCTTPVCEYGPCRCSEYTAGLAAVQWPWAAKCDSRLVDTCVFVCALGQRLRSAPTDLDPRRRFASVHSASDSTSPSRRIAAAELFTDARTRNWFPLQRIRRVRPCTLWTRQYLSFAGARQVASVAAGQGGLLVAMPPPPWLAW